MRTRILSALLAAVALLPIEARAQAPAEDASTEGSTEAGGETEGAEVVDQGDQVKLTEGGKTSAPGEVHTVTKGDTLWDLSQRFLGSPWYWPKVWSYNPEIANPHWIYPGNLVRFFPSGEEVPTQVEVGTGPEPEETVEAADRLPEESSGVTVAGKIGYTPKQSARFSNVGFVTKKELDEAGVIDSSFSEHTLLSYPDTVYISFKRKSDAKIGDRYVIFKTKSEVVHPVTGNDYGYLTQFLGTVKVMSMTPKLVTALIETTADEVSRGDLIGPMGEQLAKNVTLRANERELKGFIIATMDPAITMLGEHHLVIIDRGSSDGVQAGNTFTVIRQSDGKRADFNNPAEAEDELPIEDVATCMAVDVKDKATTCMLTRSLRELVIGDRVVMRQGNSGGGPRASR
ncbi:MAG: LysM peptidoglycan-binding domain-containing protein [Myxococcaceae bacterium]